MISTIITHHRLWLAGHIMQDAKQLHPKEAVSVSPTWRTSVPLTSHGKNEEAKDLAFDRTCWRALITQYAS